MDISILQFFAGLIFLSLIFLNLTKKNYLASLVFGVQSFAVMMIFLSSYLETRNVYVLLIVLLTLVIKVILAPMFFIRLIEKHQLSFSVSTYLNMPLTLIVIAMLTFLAHSERLLPLTNIIPLHQGILAIALSGIFISLFMIVNRKEAISQIISILSLENSIVVFAIFAGLEQFPGLQIGIIFDIFVWIIISTIFVTMIYEQFGSNIVTTMNKLKD